MVGDPSLGYAPMTHRYRATCHWEGSTALGYDAYGRTHTVTVPPATAPLTVSADAAFGGDPALCNPESLVVAAAASCQLLSFLAVCARARVDVTDYRDDATAVMGGEPLCITEIALRPKITVAGPVTVERVRHLAQVAHRECYIANTLSARITVEPEVTAAPPAPG
jgi:organic hydroperoxide reductase OsmC/OhrA